MVQIMSRKGRNLKGFTNIKIQFKGSFFNCCNAELKAI